VVAVQTAREDGSLVVQVQDDARAAGFSRAIDRIAVESLPCGSIDHSSEDKYRRAAARLVPSAVAAAEVHEISGRLSRLCSCDAWIGVS